jgi:hypothetical protein
MPAPAVSGPDTGVPWVEAGIPDADVVCSPTGHVDHSFELTVLVETLVPPTVIVFSIM